MIEQAAITQTIAYERNGHIARLTLNNPKRHNSLGEDQLNALQARLTEIEQDRDLRVLIVTGAGDKTFCAGASLGELGGGKISGDQFQHTTDQLAALPIPTICALNGNVYGGGVELALSCDFRVGITGTRLRVPAAAIGLCYPLGGINRFVERLGITLTKRMLIAAEEFTAEQLATLGFLDYLVDRDELDITAQRLAENIQQLAPMAVRAMKAIIGQAAADGIQPEQGSALANACLESLDLQEGFAAQREKRKPRFSGH